MFPALSFAGEARFVSCGSRSPWWGLTRRIPWVFKLYRCRCESRLLLLGKAAMAVAETN